MKPERWVVEVTTEAGEVFTWAALFSSHEDAETAIARRTEGSINRHEAKLDAGPEDPRRDKLRREIAAGYLR